MKIFIYFLIFQSLIYSTDSLGNSERNKQKNIIKLLNVEKKILTKKYKRNPIPKWRWHLMKIQMERYKIIHQKENEKFVKTPTSLRHKKGKGWFFKKSKALYKDIKFLGAGIVKRWPRFKENDHVYYSLSMNEINHNNPQTIKRDVPRFLKMALKYTHPKNHPLRKAILTGLAEHYYNHKKYDKAIFYYKRLLKKKNNKWITKHLFNLSWSYMELNKPQKALGILERTWRLSKKRKKGKPVFIDYSKQAMESLPLFFVRAKKVKRGVRFFSKQKNYSGDHIMKMAKYARERGEFATTMTIYNSALEEEKGRKNRKGMIGIILTKLDIFDEFKRKKRYFNTTQHLVNDHLKKPIPEDLRLEFLEKTQRYIAKMQKLSKKLKFKNKRLTKDILVYFDFLKKIDKKNSGEYAFYQGETLFAIEDYDRAIPYYFEGINFYRKNQKDNKKKNKETVQKIFDSIFLSLGKSNLNKKTLFKRRTKAYHYYLAIYPVGKLSSNIYQRLFNSYFQKKKLKQCRKTLARYHKNYPKEIQKQQFMLAKLFDYAAHKKDVNKMLFWIKKMESGYLSFNHTYVKKAHKSISDIILEKAFNEKDLAKSTELYESTYKNTNFTPLVRAKAAYFLGKISISSLKTKESTKWLHRSLKIIPTSQIDNFENDYLNNIQEMVNLQDFSNSWKLADSFFKKACKNKNKFHLKNDFFNAIVLYSTVDGKDNVALKNFKKAKECSIRKGTQLANLKYMTQFYFTHNEYDKLDHLLSVYGRYDNKLHHFFAKSFVGLYWDGISQGSTKKTKYALKHLNSNLLSSFSLNNSLTKEIRAIISFSKFKKELEQESITFSFHNLEKKFNEDNFNKALEDNLIKLEELTSKITGHIKTGYPQIVAYGHYTLFKNYKAFSKAIQNFDPQMDDENYKKSFLQSMSNLSDNFLKQSEEQRKIGVSVFRGRGIFFPKASKMILKDDHIINKIAYRYPSSLYPMTLDIPSFSRAHKAKKRGSKK
ncbi:MAG: hypothetical protein OXB88_02345 [Bacteriovoracales bacterium]|nr:hypothetical protein [Bacteriovoracales bacterium]